MDTQLTRNEVENQTGGFSLVELLLVVAILSILSVTVGLSVSHLGSTALGDRARFLALDEILRKQSLLTRQSYEIIVSDRGFRRASTADNDLESQSIENLWETAPDWVTPPGPNRRIAYLPDGRSTPITLDFRENTRIIRCVSDGWTGPICADR